ncbi:hypothetical protein G6L68_25270 [Agrobacterium fabrum]|uniref:hypothetical protein n=1 Tax=Agrobacterium fabrum TaxID=1176649 RepID=UPI000EF5E9F7|nr:hypothetical protein [Agrobacterium fabrum]AYM66198.1 hypothetical protein At12D13_50460 [Agrobacterium fabrum]NTE63945.1 hypothetical protein [Agrobacterium fabrum]
MSDRLNDFLRAKYPRLIPEVFGFECFDGWLQLLDDFFSVVDRELPEGATFRLLQVKEKLGGLRIYFRLDDDIDDEISQRIHDAYDRAAARSYRTCEICGKRGRFSKRGGLLTVVCEEHQIDGDGRKAVPQEPEADYYRRANREQWQRFDYDANVFVPCDPPEDQE